jgi:HlyD family secretion protein
VQNVVTYDVVIQVNNQDFKLMPGMTANVSVIITTKHDVVRITNAAMRFRFSERPAGTGAGTGGGADAGVKAGAPEKKGPAVWILENGKPKRISITPGISDGNYTEIVSGDLKNGDQVIVESLKKGGKTQAPSGPRMF